MTLPILNQCPVCRGTNFVEYSVLWDELVHDWALSAMERHYINRQQGLTCLQCHCNLRSMSLARAICKSYGFAGTFLEFLKSPVGKRLHVLEINEAGGLTPLLRTLPHHTLVTYPMFDMTQLDLPDAIYDLVVHSDTLEHVPDAVRGLTECRRVLASDGRCIYTVPMVVDRLSRTREGLKESFHGAPNGNCTDYLVHHEFGSDAWILAAKAGFSDICFHILEYPAGISIEARS